jgi:hypothetical protein
MIWNVTQDILDIIINISQLDNTENLEKYTFSSSESGTIINNITPSSNTYGIAPRVNGTAGDNTKDDAITVFSDKNFSIWGLFTGSEGWVKLDTVNVNDPEYKGYVTLPWLDNNPSGTDGYLVSYYVASNLTSQDLTNGESHDIYIAKHPNNSTTDLKTGSNLILDYKFDGDVNDYRMISLKGSKLFNNQIFTRVNDEIEPVNKKMTYFEVDIDLSSYSPGSEIIYTINENRRISNIFLMADGVKGMNCTFTESLNGNDYTTILTATMIEDHNVNTKWKLYYKLK